MSIRANWKGFLRFGEISCPVALYTGASTSERVSFQTINRATGHRVKREFVDPETGRVVDRDHQIRGFEIDTDQYVQLEPEEVAQAVPEADKKLSVSAFISCADIDTVYFDRPYYLAPSSTVGQEAFAVIREALRASKVAALAHAVLFRRYRSLMIRSEGFGLVAHTLNFDYEVRSAAEAFADIPKLKIKGEMLDLAQHIIRTKIGKFDAASFDDRYESALSDLIRAKMAGKTIKLTKKAASPKPTDLMAALRASIGSTPPPPKPRSAKKAA
ncbi:MAG TPA: Ku protein [Bosea sp. (in: a-proteobacteria)]|uniref:non-homologous end joining protein Ku n=1 Tax=Bosea sp. (in: a-proteobacteria) TaxID=1871050 RepID=UPI002E0E6E84|nr:Ku protein [Bosea sp. (in: a-proteobacteria)]